MVLYFILCLLWGLTITQSSMHNIGFGSGIKGCTDHVLSISALILLRGDTEYRIGAPLMIGAVADLVEILNIHCKCDIKTDLSCCEYYYVEFWSNIN